MRTLNILGTDFIVDDHRYDELSKMNWLFVKENRATTKIGNSLIGLHRIVMNAKKGEVVDHINRNPLDNRECNLRITDFFGNNANKLKPKNSTRKYKNIIFTNSGKWKVEITSKGKIHRKYFEEENDALQWRNKKLVELHGEFANTAS